jgi:hypothetical protein
MAKIIKTLVMIAFGIVLAVGGIQWTIQTSRMIDLNNMPVVMVTDDFNLTMQPISGYNSWRRATFFPAIMGIIGGIVWIICGFGNMSFPGGIWMATGIMLIPIGALNFFRGFTELWKLQAAYPSTILRYLFVEHPKLSIFIFAAAAFVCILIGLIMEGILSSAGKVENK